MGAANAAAGVSQGFSIGASGSRTAVNDGMGARSQVAGIVAAATVLVILLFLTEPVRYLPNAVLGTPSLDGAGVLAVGTYDFTTKPNAIYLVNAATGRIIRTLLTGGYDFAQSVFADGRLFAANSNGVYSWGLPGGG